MSAWIGPGGLSLLAGGFSTARWKGLFCTLDPWSSGLISGMENWTVSCGNKVWEIEAEEPHDAAVQVFRAESIWNLQRLDEWVHVTTPTKHVLYLTVDVIMKTGNYSTVYEKGPYGGKELRDSVKLFLICLFGVTLATGIGIFLVHWK